MSAIQTVHLVDRLVKAKIPKQTATELLDYFEKRKDKAVNLQWIAISILTGALFGGIWYLSNKIDAARKEIKAEINNRIDRVEKRNIEREQEINKKLDQLLLQTKK